MHDCPECGQACDCDGEDTWNSGPWVYLHCQHDCDPEEDDFFDDDEYEEYLETTKDQDGASCADEHPLHRNGDGLPLPEASAEPDPGTDKPGSLPPDPVR